MTTEVERWRSASAMAGYHLERWFMKHPKILRRIAPKLPEIITRLQMADLAWIEKTLREGFA